MKIITFLMGTGLFFSASPALANESVPKYKLEIKIPELTQPVIKIDGSVVNSIVNSRFAILPGQVYKFDVDGKTIEVVDGQPIKQPASLPVHFVGTTTLVPTAKVQATKDEFYCLNKVYPNPEVYSDGGLYECAFSVPPGFSILWPHSTVVQRNGLEFQVAKMSPPKIVDAKTMAIQLQMPADFQPDKTYLQFIGSVLDKYVDRFGGLAFSTLQVGAIKRGGDTEINGSASGDLILFSRTALGAPLNQSSAHPDDSKIDLTNALRRMVIAHELAHLWYGERFQSDEAWFIEGVPQYLGLLESAQSVSPEQSAALFAFMRKRAETVAHNPILQASLESKEGFVQAYYAAPLALYDIGEKVGHERLIKLLVEISNEKPKVTFADFDKAFKQKFPQSVNDWNQLWQVQ
jgi:hypothetical protein